MTFIRTIAVALLAALPAGAVEFKADVAPILTANCLGCHGKVDPSAQLRLDSVERILEGSAQRAVVVPGKPDESLLIHVLTGESGPKMPPDPLLPLTGDEVETLRQWIASLNPVAEDEAEETPETIEPENEEPEDLTPEPEEFISSGDPVFDERIHPILQSNCVGCHSGPKAAAGLNLASLDRIARGSKRGAVVVPGKPDESSLYAIVHKNIMPPKPMAPLSDDDKNAIREWIASLDASRWAALSGEAVTEKETRAAPAAHPLDESLRSEVKDDIAFEEIGAMAFHPDEPLLAVGRLHRVDLYRFDDSTNRFEYQVSLEGHAHLVRSLKFSPDGSRLAAAGGKPSIEGEIVLWDAETYQPLFRAAGHDDCVYDLEFSPDGARIATCSYDRSIKLWNADNGAEQATLLDHVDAVYAIDFSPDGARLASAAGDRTVKVWEVESGERLFTLSEPTMAQYAVAFHPDGQRLAAAGADKMIRVWRLGESNGSLLESKFAHEGPVLDVAYLHDGKTLVSTAEDRLVKAWNAETFIEDHVWGPQNDWVFAMAADGEQRRLALGCYDGALSLVDLKDGALIAALDRKTVKLAKANSAGSEPEQTIDDGDPFRVRVVQGNGTYLSALSYLTKRAMLRGQSHELVIHGKNLEDAEILFDDPAISAKILDVKKKPLPEFKRAEFTTAAEIVDTGFPYELKVELTVGSDARPGIHRLWARTPLASTNTLAFAVETREAVNENEESDEQTPARLDLPAIAAGSINHENDEDEFRFETRAGQELVFNVVDRELGSGLSAVVELFNVTGERLASSETSGLPFGYRFEHGEEHRLKIRDALLRKGGFYRLHVDESPLLTNVFPLGARRGHDAEFQIEGFNLDGKSNYSIAVDSDGDRVQPFDFENGNPLNAPRLALSDNQESIESAPNDTHDEAARIDTPHVYNGRIETPGDVDWVRFSAKKGQPLAVAVEAQQLGSPLDSIIEIRDGDGAPIEIATVRCLAETFLTLSDRDSRSGGMRLDSWADLSINDYMMVGSEILKVVKLPDYPDEDVLFARNDRFGWRYGLFGTTPSHHAVYAPAYKVSIHEPGRQFAPNGMPVFRLYAENDDGGAPTYRKDSYFEFHPPADGEYFVSITDAMGRGGDDFAYRLHVRPPQPDFNIFIDNSRPNLHEGGRYPLRIIADRIEGFNGPIHVELAGLPDGFHATGGLILPGEESCSILLSADESARSTEWGERFIVEARAEIDGEPRVRESRIDLLSVVRPADVTIEQTPAELTLIPGQSVKCTVRIQRHNGFAGRVPIDVRNLPFGVYVMDTGLNGILVTEDETERTYEIYAEPWVKPVERRFYSIASVETRSPIRHWNASNESTLRIVAPDPANAISRN